MRSVKKITAFALALGLMLSNGIACYASGTNEWHKKDGRYYYLDENGERETKVAYISGSEFFFDENGYTLTGFQSYGGGVYYCDPRYRGAVTLGWKTIGDYTFYFGPDGTMRIGWQEIDGETYYFKGNGIYDDISFH